MIMEKICIDVKDKILIVAPHPDDESIGCGGLIMSVPDKCSVCVVTDGAKGGKNTPYYEEKRIREEQFKKSMQYAGVHDYCMLSYPDGELMCHPDCMEKVDFTQYNKVFLPYGDDNHPDHMATYIYSLNRIFDCNIDDVEIFAYEVHLPIRSITHYFDISDVIEQKRKLIGFHKDQVEDYCYAETAVALNGYRACQANMPQCFYEGFVRIDRNNCDIDIEKIEREKVIQKYKQYFRLLSKWVKLQENGKNEPIFGKFKWKKVSVFGYTTIARIVISELEKENIEVVEIIDSIIRDIPGRKCVLPENGNKQVNVVIMVAPYRDYKIEDNMKNLGYQNIVSVYDVVSEL